MNRIHSPGCQLDAVAGPGRLVSRLTLALIPLMLAACQAPAQDGGVGPGDVFLSFTDAPAAGQPLSAVPTLLLSFGKEPRRAVMDTGSTGVVVSAEQIPDWVSLPSLGPAELTYSSSGRVMRGRWVVTPLTVTGANGTSVITDPMPVMAVTGIACLDNARDCVAEDAPRGVSMLGVGFARQGDHQAQSTPDRNAFLRVAGNRMQRGYVVTSRGVKIGLVPEEEKGFVTVPLSRSDRFDDWAAPSACISVASHVPPSCGTILVDTGVSRAFLTVPTAQLRDVTGGEGDRTLPSGTQVDVRLAQVAGADWGYSFTAGDLSTPVTPHGVTLVRPGERPTFLNTSFHFLNGFDYLYDADKGMVGYRPRSP